VISWVLRIKAPDEEVIAQDWYKQVKGTAKPTRQQRCEYILKSKAEGGPGAPAPSRS